jgi:serine/threonine protein kinase
MDLKPENLLLYRKASLEIKIVDFGLAVQLQEGQEVKSLVGTAEYVSPEILSFEALSTFSDMW